MAPGAVLLFRVGRRRRVRRRCSPTRITSLTDVITSLGVLVGVALVAVTGWLVLDSDHRRVSSRCTSCGRAGC